MSEIIHQCAYCGKMYDPKKEYHVGGKYQYCEDKDAEIARLTAQVQAFEKAKGELISNTIKENAALTRERAERFEFEAQCYADKLSESRERVKELLLERDNLSSDYERCSSLLVKAQGRIERWIKDNTYSRCPKCREKIDEYIVRKDFQRIMEVTP